MNITVLGKKPKVTIDEKEYIDLSVNSFNTGMVYNGILGYDIVTVDTVMRIDKIALKWYGTTKHIDILLKANNIFNPFSIQVDDVLMIPNIRESSAIHRKVGEISKKDLRDAIIKTQTNKKSDISNLDNMVNGNKNKKNRLKNPLPPNMMPIGDSNRKVDGGLLNLTNNK